MMVNRVLALYEENLALRLKPSRLYAWKKAKRHLLLPIGMCAVLR